MNNIAIKVEALNKSFKVLGGSVQILKHISFEINSYEFAVIYGPSGCGKSTLLHTILGLEKPNSGTVTVLGKNIYDNYSEDKLAIFRKEHIGTVYQQSNWIKAINVIENVAFPLTLLGVSRTERLERATRLLESVQMLDWAHYNPAELSSGQQQKVSLVRALISDPQIIIADEPTGNLDFESGSNLMKLLKKLSTLHQKTILMVTHDLDYLKLADKAINLFDGQVTKIYSPQINKLEIQDISLHIKKHA
ncbi:MAG: ABC transporter ATP-binding protein [bacterium]